MGVKVFGWPWNALKEQYDECVQITICNQILALIIVKQAVLENQKIIYQIEAFASICLSDLRRNSKFIFSGNGRNFADAQHLSVEFTSRLLFDRALLASLA